jgi:hypothetical protein
VRLSRPRFAVRAALLLAGGSSLGWRAAVSWRSAGRLEGAEAELGRRFALVLALVAALAVGTGLAAVARLLRRPAERTLRLGDLSDGPKP